MITMGLLVHFTPFEMFFLGGKGGQIEMKLKRTNIYVYIHQVLAFLQIQLTTL